jgi:hypothetical protein
MSLASWKAEFYERYAGAVPEEDALAHSLTKWQGLLPDALDRHGCYVDNGVLKDTDTGTFSINGSSCALCHCYVHETTPLSPECPECPLYKVRGMQCDAAGEDAEYDSPYHQFSMHDDPQPMLELLEEAIKRSQSGDL